MRGLLRIPSLSQLEKAYVKLYDKPLIEEKKLALWSQWTRFDPRLGEIIVDYLSSNWQKLNPLKLNAEVKKQPWPAVLGVLLELAEFKLKLQNSNSNENNELFLNWKKCITTNLPKANYEQFFIGVYSFAGKQIRKVAAQPLVQYIKWGYLGNSILINKYSKQQRFTLIPKSVRQQILTSLIDTSNYITVADYLNALNHNISRRQAQRDLTENKRLQAKSFTKGRYYQRKTNQ